MILAGIAALLLTPFQSPFPKDTAKGIIEDFESGSFANWKITGSFGRANLPTSASDFILRYKTTPVTNFEGKFFALSIDRSNAETGKAVSPSFEIPKDWGQISFRILGGNDPAKLGFRLVRDDSGSVVRTVTGDGSLVFVTKSWNVSDLQGQRVHLEIEDSATGNFGFIGVDEIRGATEAAIAKANKIPPIDFSNLPYQQQVKQMADGWRSKYGFPGVWCAYVKDGKVVACLASGVKNNSTGAPATVKDYLNVGSVSKVITGSLIAFFIADGTIRYGSTVGEVFPELAKQYPNSPLLRATLQHLMTHTAGLPHGLESLSHRMASARAANATDARQNLIALALNLKGLKEPGEESQYSNLGVSIAVSMVERLSHRSYESWLQGKEGSAIGLRSTRMLDSYDLSDSGVASPHYLENGVATVSTLEELKKHGQYKDQPSGGCSLPITDLAAFTVFTISNSAKLPSAIYDQIVQPWSGDAKNHTRAAWGWHGNSFLTVGGNTSRGEYCLARVSPELKTGFIFYTNSCPREQVDADGENGIMPKINTDIAKFITRR